MEQKETKPMRNIYQRILDIMSEVSYIQKEDKKVAGQYRYVSHDAVASIIHPQLVKHGVVVIPTVKEMMQDGNRTSVCLLVTFINADAPEESFVVESYGYGIDTADKGPGKSVSYAYKYALLKTFCLETGDDPDQDQNVKYEPPKQESVKDVSGSRTISQEQYHLLLNFDLPMMENYKNYVFQTYKISDYSQLMMKDFDKVYEQAQKVYENICKRATK